MSKLRQIYMIRHARITDLDALEPSDEMGVRTNCRAMGGLMNGKVVVIFHASTKSSMLTAELIQDELANPVGGHGRPLEIVIEKAKALSPKADEVKPKMMREFAHDLKDRSKVVNAFFIVADAEALRRTRDSITSELSSYKFLANSTPPVIAQGQGYVMDSVYTSVFDWRQHSAFIRSGR